MKKRFNKEGSDLAQILRWTDDLLRELSVPGLSVPLVVTGGLAVRAHGYERETDDVDIALTVAPANEEALLAEMVKRGAKLTARHTFGGAALEVPGGKLDVLYLYDPPDLIGDAIDEAVEANRTHELLGVTAYFVSLGYLIALKLVSERQKDISDIVETIKASMRAGDWTKEEGVEVLATVRKHLGWHGAKRVNDLAAVARAEMGL